MNLFKGKIKCKLCGKNYKVKKEKKRYIYICSGYTNQGKDFCSRRVISEHNLIFLCKGKTSAVTSVWIEENVKQIFVGENKQIEIEFKDGTTSCMLDDIIYRQIGD